MKKIKLLLCLTACLFALNGCSILAEQKPVDEMTRQKVEMVASSVTTGIFIPASTDQEFQNYLNTTSPEEFELQLAESGVYVEGEAFKSGLASWFNATKRLGDQITATGIETAYDPKGTEIVVRVNVQGNLLNSKGRQREATVEYVFEDNYYNTMNSCATNIIFTFGEKINNAAMNTLIGMGTVFAILILLSLIIGCFGIFPKLEAKRKAKAAKALSEDVAEPVATATEEVMNDTEIVAVISAAIAAYESTNDGNTDGYVVRSIKRRR